MGTDAIFLYVIAAVAVCFALVNALLLLLKRGKTGQTIGTISSIKMPNAEMAKARNSKWAELTYTVDGKTYRSKNRIQVSMTSQIGDSVTVRYDVKYPEKLYSFSASRIIASLLSLVFVYWLHFSNWYEKGGRTMPYFPQWFVIICVLLPVASAIYKAWKNRKK